MGKAFQKEGRPRGGGKLGAKSEGRGAGVEGVRVSVAAEDDGQRGEDHVGPSW